MLDYVCVSVCGPAPLLDCRPIRVRVSNLTAAGLLGLGFPISQASVSSTHPTAARQLPRSSRRPPAAQVQPPPREAHASLPGRLPRRALDSLEARFPSLRRRPAAGALLPSLRHRRSPSPPCDGRRRSAALPRASSSGRPLIRLHRATGCLPRAAGSLFTQPPRAAWAAPLRRRPPPSRPRSLARPGVRETRSAPDRRQEGSPEAG
jgi:hypothetical protein